MIPSVKWFPLSLAERAAWYENFNRVIQTIGAGLGLTAGELATIQADCDMLRFLARASTAIGAHEGAFQSFRRLMTEGDTGDVTPQFPELTTLVPPPGSTAGIFERLDKFVKRIRTAPGFTPETEASLQIAPTRYKLGKRHLESETGPQLKVSTEPGNVVLVKFIRGSSHGVWIETLIDNDTEWQRAGTFVKSPATLRIPQNDDRLPRRVQVRARFLEQNDPVGERSGIVTIATEP